MIAPDPLAFFGQLVWLDGRPLLDTIEPYRRKIFTDVLATMDGVRPQYNLALCGRAKKNWKTSDLILAALYRFLVWESPAGNDAFVLANDEGQASDDLDLAKKLITANPTLAAEVDILKKEIVRRDGRGHLQILPARDVAGAHGKTYLFVGFDEIHGYRSHDLFEALAPDPTRLDALTWITSYAGIRHAPGIPLYDFLLAGRRGDDPRMFFSWYGGDFTTDPALAGEGVTQERRANPSMENWGNDGYLDQQRRRLPTHKFRRLHLNLPGAPDGAAFSADAVMSSIVSGRKRLEPAAGAVYHAFVDMSGGSNDNACLGIAHCDETTKRSAVDLLVPQTGGVPFNPRDAVRKFAGLIKEYGLSRVTGDAYAGETFRADFESFGISYQVAGTPKSAIYDALDPRLNAGEVELLDIGELQEQLLTLVFRGGRIDHQPGDHDDYANAAAGALWLAAGGGPMPGAGIFGFTKMLADEARAQSAEIPVPSTARPKGARATLTAEQQRVLDETRYGAASAEYRRRWGNLEAQAPDHPDDPMSR